MIVLDTFAFEAHSADVSPQPFCEPAPAATDLVIDGAATVCQADPPDVCVDLGGGVGQMTRSFLPCTLPSDNQWTEQPTIAPFVCDGSFVGDVCVNTGTALVAPSMPVTGAAETSAMCGLALMCVVGGVALVRWAARR